MPGVIDRVVRELAYRHRVRHWPWEHVVFSANDSFRTECLDDRIQIRGDLFGWGTSLHAIADVNPRALRLYERTGAKSQFIEAIDEAIADVARWLHTRPDYTPPPKGWRRFDRPRRAPAPRSRLFWRKP
jgi:hypothetical protein